MGPGARALSRRTLLRGGGAAGVGVASWLATGCEARDPPPAEVPVRWVGTTAERGHRLRREPPAWPAGAAERQAGALVLGGGIAGLAAARALRLQGVQELHLLELEDEPGGNSRGHSLGGRPCPLGAHYLPLPGPEPHRAREVFEWLHEIGLLRQHLGRTEPDERHLCHSPQERLFVDGVWHEGLLPPLPAAGRQQAAHFARRVRALQGAGGRAFALPARRALWGPGQESLNRLSFAAWLAAEGITEPRLRWYLDYACRDDYGASAATVSAWAGVHYFACRGGFAAPGEDEAAHEPVFTWPQGNQWLVQRLAAPLAAAGGLHAGRTVLRVAEERRGVRVLAWNQQAGRPEVWRAPVAVLAVPLFVAARVLESPPAALLQAAQAVPTAPWVVANLELRERPLARGGVAAAWDNVVFGSTSSLGYVDASHQQLGSSTAGGTVFTVYLNVAPAERGQLLADAPGPWLERALAALRPAHPDIDRRVRAADLARHGHAMAVPVPGLHRHRALEALASRAALRGRVRFAHADLAGYSVFEESFAAGHAAGSAALPGARA